MSDSARRSELLPYLLVGLGWFVLLVFASRFRTIEPIFLWVMTQGLLLEKISPGGWVGWLILLGIYLGAGVVAWLAIERSRRDPAHIWRRALFAWVGVQAIYCVIATALVQFGILYE